MDEQDDLERLFARARADTALPEPLAVRMLADATRLQAMRARPPRWRRLGDQLLETLGGWYGAGGLAAACAAGLWLGLAPPAGLPDPVALMVAQGGDGTADLFGSETLVMAMAEDME